MRTHTPLAQTRRAIERVSNGTVYSVTNSTLTPPSGDKRDYMSIGPYMWPCNNNPCNKTGASANTTCDVETGLPWVCWCAACIGNHLLNVLFVLCSPSAPHAQVRAISPTT